MEKINFNTNNIIILVFPAWAGGKFVSNCLSLSNHVLSQCSNKQYIYDLLRNDNSYSYELSDRIALNSLPSKIVIGEWSRYEYHSWEFFNVDRGISYNENEYHDYIIDISNSNKKFFMIAHDQVAIDTARMRWPNAKEIHLTNYHEFRDRSIELKLGDVGLRAWRARHEVVKKLSSWHRARANAFIDISKIYDFPLWSIEIQRLYKTFEFNDFDQDRLHTFWKAYIDLHI